MPGQNNEFDILTINGYPFNTKDSTARNDIASIIGAIQVNNTSISGRINDLNERSFDDLIKISSNDESEISNIDDGLYKIQYITEETIEEETIETVNNTAILIQSENNQYLYKYDKLYSRIKENNTWSNWKSLLPIDYSKQYFTIVSLTDNTNIYWITSNSNFALTISISTDNGISWVEKTSTTEGIILSTLNTGDKLLIKGNNKQYHNNSGYYNYFFVDNQFDVEGNIMSLLYKDNFSDKYALYNGYSNTFTRLFTGCINLINAKNLILPATSLVSSCYSYMFYNCSSLITTPELPATTLSSYCYDHMFHGCSSLVKAPELPATTLDDHCYANMFYGCTSLIKAPELPAKTLAYSCYANMFYGCTSLIVAPKLHTSTLEYGCYAYMFGNCTSLVTAPELPATTLQRHCYTGMFYGCSSLVKAPELPALSLELDCYSDMFKNCSSLVKAPELPATTLINYCYSTMFYGCSSLKYIKCLATDISASGCTENWTVYTGSSNTIFVKADNMSDWTTGSSGIHSDWTVYTESEYELVHKYEISSLTQVQSNWNESNSSSAAYIQNKPSIPVVNNSLITLRMNGSNIESFTTNQSSNKIIDLGTISGLPSVNSSNNGKILMVIDGQWTLVSPSVIYSGSETPNNENGNNGDIYIQTE